MYFQVPINPGHPKSCVYLVEAANKVEAKKKARRMLGKAPILGEPKRIRKDVYLYNITPKEKK